MIDAVDSYWRHAVDRMTTINSSRQMLGVMAAQDWPPKTVRFESFYLLLLGEAPAPKQFWSASVPVMSHMLQWVWMVAGTDLQSGRVGRSRGDRYRTDMQMKDELRQANYPLFGEKKSWSASGQNASSIQLVGVSLNPPEYLRWTPLEYHTNLDKDSGLIYGAAKVSLVDMTDSIAA